MKTSEPNSAFEIAEAEIEEVTVSIRLKNGPPVTSIYSSKELRDFKFRWKEQRSFERRDEFNAQATGRVDLVLSMSYVVKKIESDFLEWQKQHPH